MRKLYCIPLCIAVLAITGCSDNGLSADEKEERDPQVKTGVAYMEQSQWDEAEQAFKDALDSDPLMAKPHLDLALIYQQYKPDYIHAIYHYDRYLELRPESEKATLILEQRNKVERALAIQAIKESSDFKKLAAEALRLKKENTALRNQLAAAQAAQNPQPSATSAEPEVETAATQPATTSARSHKIYNVVAGDTLSKISKKFYGDSNYSDVIYEANRDSLSNPNALRIGQTLVIPVGGQN